MPKLWSYFHFQALATVPVPVTESSTGTSPVTEPGTGPGTGSGTGFHWWFRYRCEIKFRSGPNMNLLSLHHLYIYHTECLLDGIPTGRNPHWTESMPEFHVSVGIQDSGDNIFLW